MIAARREAMRHVPLPDPPAHVGLELDRYLSEAVGDDNKALRDLLERACGAQTPEIYQAAYDRWRATLDGWGETVDHGVFAVTDRLIVGLGGGGVRETGVTLHHVYGVPIIPGSALKGLARRYAGAALAAAVADPDDATTVEDVDAQFEALVGSPDNAAILTFFDAWYVPGSAPNNHPLQPDVITVHHPTYYGSRGTKGYGPWDFDDPTPIPFVRQAGSYLVAVRGPNTAWAAFGLAALEHALAEWGVGAKTSAGYGRLRKTDPDEAAALALTAEIAGHAAPTVEELRGWYERWTVLGAAWRPGPARAMMVHLSAPRLQGQVNLQVGWGRAIQNWAQQA